MPQTPIRSYTSIEQPNPLGACRESRQLLRRTLRSSAHMAEEVRRLIDITRTAEDFLLKTTGMAVANLTVLEIGPGQLPRQLAYFSARNDVTGIDLDVIPIGLNIGAYLRLLKENGPKRFLKTLARKMLRFDARFRAEIARQLNLPRLPRPKLLQMDATAMTFPDNSFDFIYSFDVFEHFPDPRAVLLQCARVLRPGGCLLHSIHPYTADDGSHDLRISFGRRGSLPFWPHLRPQFQNDVQQFAFLNRLSLTQWRDLFQSTLPGSHFMNLHMNDQSLQAPLQQIRAAGELSQFSDEELLTDRLIAVWQKPPLSSPVPA